MTSTTVITGYTDLVVSSLPADTPAQGISKRLRMPLNARHG
jgi:hypothetical protein